MPGQFDFIGTLGQLIAQGSIKKQAVAKEQEKGANFGKLGALLRQRLYELEQQKTVEPVDTEPSKTEQVSVSKDLQKFMPGTEIPKFPKYQTINEPQMTIIQQYLNAASRLGPNYGTAAENHLSFVLSNMERDTEIANAKREFEVQQTKTIQGNVDEIEKHYNEQMQNLYTKFGQGNIESNDLDVAEKWLNTEKATQINLAKAGENFELTYYRPTKADIVRKKEKPGLTKYQDYNVYHNHYKNNINRIQAILDDNNQIKEHAKENNLTKINWLGKEVLDTDEARKLLKEELLKYKELDKKLVESVTAEQPGDMSKKQTKAKKILWAKDVPLAERLGRKPTLEDYQNAYPLGDKKVDITESDIRVATAKIEKQNEIRVAKGKTPFPLSQANINAMIEYLKKQETP